MAEPPRRDRPLSAPPLNAEQARDAINRGVTGDKVPGLDPAAAPLGADEEAGGAPLHPADWGREIADRARGAPPPRGSAPELTPDGGDRRPLHRVILPVLGYAALIAGAILVIIAFLIWLAR